MKSLQSTFVSLAIVLALPALLAQKQVDSPSRSVRSLMREVESKDSAAADAALEHLRRRLWRLKDEPESDYRFLVDRCLGEAGRSDPARCRRAATLLFDLAPRVGPDLDARIGQTLLRALERTMSKKVQPEAVRARAAVKLALTRLRVYDVDLATDLAVLFLADLRAGVNYGGDPLVGLARTLSPLNGTLRQRVFATLCEALTDEARRYMVTSGERSPYRHSGSEALVLAASTLRRVEVARVLDRLGRAREAAANDRDLTPADRASMFDELAAALAARRQKLERK